MLLLLQIAAKSFETCPECFPQWSLQDYLVDLSNFEFPIFNNFFSKISNSVVAYGEIKNLRIWKTRVRRAKLSEIWDLRGVVQHI